MFRVDKIEDIKAVHFGIVHVLHFVGHRPVCADCARVAFSAGLPVDAGAFPEGSPVECESTFVAGMFVPYGVCTNVTYSAYGSVE